MEGETSFDLTQILGLIIALIALGATLVELVYNLFFRKKTPNSSDGRGKREVLEKLFSESERPKKAEKEGIAHEREYSDDEYVEEDFTLPYGVHHEYESQQQDEQDSGKKKIFVSTTRPPSPPPVVVSQTGSTYQGLPVHPEEKFQFHPALEAYKQKTAIESRGLEIHLRPSSEELISDAIKKFGSDEHFMKKAAPPRIRAFLSGLRSKRALVIAKEIIDVPLSLRDKPR